MDKPGRMLWKGLVLGFLLAVTLSGCAKVVSESYEVVPAVITDAEYTPAYTVYSYTNKQMQAHHYPESGGVEIVVKGRNEWLSGVSFYERFKDCVGDEVWAIIRIRAYDNDKVKEKVINLFLEREQAERVLEQEG